MNRLDYDYKIHGGVFPAHIESCNSAKVARWLSKVLHLIPIEPRPDGYSPLGIKNLTPKWVAKLGQSGRDCYNAIVRMDAKALGASFNLNMKCWETLLPHVVRHPLLRVGFDADFAGVSKAIPGRDVFRLRRRIFDCCFPGAGARRIQGECSRRPKMNPPQKVIVSGGFDDIKSRDLRFLEEAAKLGELTVLLWTDDMLRQVAGKAAEISAGGAALFFECRPLRQPRDRGRMTRRMLCTTFRKIVRGNLGGHENDGECGARKEFAS